MGARQAGGRLGRERRRSKRRSSLKRIRIRLFHFRRRSDKSCDRNERTNYRFEAALRRFGAAKRRAKSASATTIHAARDDGHAPPGIPDKSATIRQFVHAATNSTTSIPNVD